MATRRSYPTRAPRIPVSPRGRCTSRSRAASCAAWPASGRVGGRLDGEVVPSCTIVTCAASELVRPIHDRIPVVFAAAELWQAWLDASLDGRAACELLVPLPSGQIVVRPANPIVNSARHEGPDCLALPAAA